MTTNGEAFPDDQDQKNPDGEKPMHVEQTLGLVTKIQRQLRSRMDGRWLYAKGMTDEQIREFFKVPGGRVQRNDTDTVAVWSGTKGEPEYGAFEEVEFEDRAVLDPLIEAAAALEAVREVTRVEREKTEGPTPARDIEGTLRTAGMNVWRLLEQEAVKSNAAESGKIAAISNELHAMASRFELARLRQGMRR